MIEVPNDIRAHVLDVNSTMGRFVFCAIAYARFWIRRGDDSAALENDANDNDEYDESERDYDSDDCFWEMHEFVLNETRVLPIPVGNNDRDADTIGEGVAGKRCRRVQFKKGFERITIKTWSGPTMLQSERARQRASAESLARSSQLKAMEAEVDEALAKFIVRVQRCARFWFSFENWRTRKS